MSTPTLVRLSGLAKSFGAFVAVHPLDMEIRQGEFLAILGPSGCGKTTLLRMIGGFVAPSTGSISIAGQEVTALPPERRPTNLVFQGYGLFPHMTVAQNIAYGLRIRKTPRREIDQRVEEAMALVHLDGFADRMVTQLSGGQAQRVALARALILRPDVLLLDEPLAALDLKLRKAMQEELRRIHAATGGTFVFVTHDQEEAMGLASRICVMQGGKVVQDGSPEEIYSRPATRFVSSFIGEANEFVGRRDAGRVRLDCGVEFARDGKDGAVVCVVRPEKTMLYPAASPAGLADSEVRLDGTLEDAVFLGTFVKYSVRLDCGLRAKVDSRDTALRDGLAVGERVTLGWRLQDQTLLPAEES